MLKISQDNSDCQETKSVAIIWVRVRGEFDSSKRIKTPKITGVILNSSMNLDTYVIMCGMSVHAIAEAKRPASVLKKKKANACFNFALVLVSVPKRIIKNK